MKNIRPAIFETNSSSSHAISISVSNEGILQTLPVSDEGVVTLSGGAFGWDWDKFSDAETKCNYAAVDTEGKSNYREMLTEVIMEHTGAKEVAYSLDTDNYGSYIDHQSVGTSFEAFQSKDLLKKFLFNPKSVLITGNDNSDAPSHFRMYIADSLYDLEP